MYDQPVGGIAAFVLAGGHSSRMGRDKAFLELAGRALIQRAVDLAGTVSGEVQIVGERAKFLEIGPTIEDLFPGGGPLAGIHAALSRTHHDLNLVLAVDLPFVTPEFLRYLLSQASQTSALVSLPRADGRWQPLCAIYRKEFGELAQRALAKKKNRIDALFSPQETRELGEAELLRMGFDVGMFRNLNTPEDFAQAQRQLSGR